MPSTMIRSCPDLANETISLTSITRCYNCFYENLPFKATMTLQIDTSSASEDSKCTCTDRLTKFLGC